MTTWLKIIPWCCQLFGMGLVLLGVFPAMAEEKTGMPDLAQIEETCLPTSTTNLIVWFGQHGYPKLIQKEDSRDNGYIHTVHSVMSATEARFDWGTQMKTVAGGIGKYVRDSGYACDVEYRGIADEGVKPFSQEWLRENDDPNKGFILLLAYIYANYSSGNAVFTPALGVGHAVTLVNAEPDMLLIHDPAHQEDETGRKIVTPQLITQGVLQDAKESRQADGLLILSGSLLGAPPNGEVIVTGAVCVTMHPSGQPGGSSSPSSGSNSDTSIAASSPGSASGVSSAKPGNTNSTSWWTWIFDLIFRK